MFKIATNMDELIKVYTVRAIVFIGEQQCPYNEEIDEHEHSCIHILGELDGEPVAAARLRFPGSYAKLERIAVRTEWRGQGLGRQLVEYMIEQSRKRGFTTLKMHAQIHLVDFYAKHGFVRHGDIFDEAGIDHYLMIREEAHSQKKV